jgi:hypothetical protein
VRNPCLLSIAALACVLALASCGGESSSDTAAAGPSELSFESPAIGPDGVISARYECGGGSIWLPLRWSQAPPGTREFVLYFGRYRNPKAKKQESPRLEVPFGILITKLDPSRHGVNALPVESEPVLIHHNLRSCVPRRGQNILLQLFALKQPLPIPEAEADTVLDLTEAVLGDGADPKDPAWVKELTEESLASAQITATYGRK